MKQKRSLILRLLPWLIALAAIAALVIFVFIPIYSQQESKFGADPEIYEYSGESELLRMESERLLFEMDPATSQFTLTDRKNGKVWYSNPPGRDKDALARGVNKDVLSSTLNVTYTTSGGEVELNNYAYSIQNQNFRIAQGEDGSIRVDYAIGKIEKKYIVPIAMTAERYEQFTGQMSKKNKKQVSSNYSLYEPSKLDKKDNKEEIIARYPSVTEQALYILKSDTSSTNKGKIEGLFRDVGYNEEEYAIDMENVAEATNNNGPVFNASVVYRLDQDELLVEIPYDSLRCEGDYPMSYVSVLPFFGAAGSDQEGYMLLPEGGGALINYNNGKLSQSAYYANLYGWDYATERKEVISETRNAFPVFGMGQPDGSFICVIEGACSYAGINADIAGRLNSYNFVYAKYNVIHYDKFNVSNRTAQLLYMYEQKIPDDTVVQRYFFTDGDNYVDMANVYGQYLRRDPELRDETASEDIPVNVEVIGAIDKMVPKLGMPIKSIVPLTTFKQTEALIDELQASGIKDLNV